MEIFNLSFLDILACTIGLLIFILVMVFILQSGSPMANVGQLVARKRADASALRTAAERDTEIARGLEAQFDQMRQEGVLGLLSIHYVLRAVQAIRRTQAARLESTWFAVSIGGVGIEAQLQLR